jgi:hypothetical protein
MSTDSKPTTSTTDASAAAAQSRGDESEGATVPTSAAGRTNWREHFPEEGRQFTLGPRIYRAVYAQPYERKASDPLYRPLWIFTLDPSTPRRDGGTAIVNVPYEPLSAGPQGKLFSVDSRDAVAGKEYLQVDLDDPFNLIRDGRDPSPSDPQFHQQMVYAVSSLVYAAFRSALGRHIAWGFTRDNGVECDPGQILLRPFGMEEGNAYYDKEKGEICFGYYRSGNDVQGLNLPGGYVFTSLSHDIIAHEVTHALLDGLRAHFVVPSGPDVSAFHEAFADLIAVFQHFSYKQVVTTALKQSKGDLWKATILTDIARQFGHTQGTTAARHRALRTVVNATETPDGHGIDLLRYEEADRKKPHDLGSVLASAVFDTFIKLFQRKTQRYVKLASRESGVLPAGDLPATLQEVLSEEATDLANQILTMLIRAIDYCPPVDLEFGEYLRAIITADYDVVRDDPWGYREAFVDSFASRGIYPKGVDSLAVDALLWRHTTNDLEHISDLTFARLQFDGDPARPANAEELHRQACVLGVFVTQSRHLEMFGLAAAADPRLEGDTVELPVVESIRSSRRAGPDGQVVFDLIAEVTQLRHIRPRGDQPGFDFYGGATIILSPRGEIRFVISKSVLANERVEKQREYMAGDGKGLWKMTGESLKAEEQVLRRVHEGDRDDHDCKPRG